ARHVLDIFEPLRRVTIHFVSADGAAVSGAEVECDEDFERTGGDGTARLRANLGLRSFTASSVGRLTAQREVLIRDDDAVVELREPRGAVLTVIVAGSHGQPRPFAEVQPSRPFFDVANGVQRLDRCTDARGIRTFMRVQPGKNVVRASWLGRTGEASVELAD